MRRETFSSLRRPNTLPDAGPTPCQSRGGAEGLALPHGRQAPSLLGQERRNPSLFSGPIDLSCPPKVIASSNFPTSKLLNLPVTFAPIAARHDHGTTASLSFGHDDLDLEWSGKRPRTKQRCLRDSGSVARPDDQRACLLPSTLLLGAWRADLCPQRGYPARQGTAPPPGRGKGGIGAERRERGTGNHPFTLRATRLRQTGSAGETGPCKGGTGGDGKVMYSRFEYKKRSPSAALSSI